MKLTLLLCLLLLLPVQVNAATYDKALFTASTTALLLDWGTTLDIENHEDRKESNPWLGEHPTRGEVNIYFGVLTGLHLGANYGISKIRDPKLRTFIRTLENIMVFTVHGKAAAHNFSLGLSVGF